MMSSSADNKARLEERYSRRPELRPKPTAPQYPTPDMKAYSKYVSDTNDTIAYMKQMRQQEGGAAKKPAAKKPAAKKPAAKKPAAKKPAAKKPAAKK